MFSPTTPLSSSFRDNYLHETLKAISLPNSMNYNDPMFNESKLKRHVDAEYNLMKSEIASVIKEKCAQSEGNTFSQLTHYRSILVSGKKLQSIGLQFVHKSFRKNNVIFLCFQESKGN